MIQEGFQMNVPRKFSNNPCKILIEGSTRFHKYNEFEIRVA